MNIASGTIILWLISTVILSWILPKKLQMPISIAITFSFLLYYDYFSMIILTTFALTTYLFAKKFSFSSRILFILIMMVSFVFIGYKALATWQDGFYIPLGLSFYSFRIIHYLFEGYKEKLPQHTLSDFLAYLFFLPTLIVGPIHRFISFKKELDHRVFKEVEFSYALERILYGYAKIIVLSDYLIMDKMTWYLTTIEQSNPMLHTYLTSVHYWLNLYFQFSGYSDIAIGFAALMGFKVIENFNFPFLASNIANFWMRWHISLSTWIKDYVYAPLAASTRRGFFSIATAMIVFGLWHEFSFNYILWGIYHALGIVIWHQFQKLKRRYLWLQNFSTMRVFHLFSWFLTMNFVILSFEIRAIILKLFM